VTRVVPRLGALDLDDLGTEVREHLRAPRPGQNAAEVEYADAV
jgi:hypothetical protein